MRRYRQMRKLLIKNTTVKNDEKTRGNRMMTVMFHIHENKKTDKSPFFYHHVLIWDEKVLMYPIMRKNKENTALHHLNQHIAELNLRKINKYLKIKKILAFPDDIYLS